MQKKLTIIIDEAVLAKELDDAYAAMARDQEREHDALEWSEGILWCVADDAR